MDALSFLREDHKSVLGMFEVLDGAPTGQGAADSGLKTMVTNLIIAESQHEAIEEQLFWPLVREVLDDGDDLADAAVEQEQAGKHLLQRLEDGEPGEPEVTLSPLAYHYQHRAEIEAVVQGADRDAAFDTLTASIGAALAADRTLGGLCDWVEAEAPRPVDLPVDGAASLKAAVIPVVLHYTTADPLG